MDYMDPEYLVGVCEYDSFNDEHYVVKKTLTKEDLLEVLKKQAKYSYGYSGYPIEEEDIDSFIQNEATGFICSIEKIEIDFLSDDELQELQNIYNKEVVKAVCT